VLRALRAGASGFLLKDTRPTEILTAISRVAAANRFCRRQSPVNSSPTSAPRARTRGSARTLLAKLSEREREVAVAVGRGRSNAEISDALFMSVATVKAHVSSILTKLDLNNRTQVALLAHDAGLIS
jgi:DNA-binding NarL/FixJ family response regulator